METESETNILNKNKELNESYLHVVVLNWVPKDERIGDQKKEEKKKLREREKGEWK